MSAPYTRLPHPIDELSLLCRGCLAESGEMKNMFEWSLVQDFFKFTDVQVQESKTISNLLCTNCEDSLMRCQAFKDQCQQADLFLRNKVKKKIADTLTNNTEILHDEIIHFEEHTENTQVYEVLTDKITIKVLAPLMEDKIYFTCPLKTEISCEEKYLKKKNLMCHLTKVHNIVENLFAIELQYYCHIENCQYNMNYYSNKKCFTERKFLNQHINKVHKTKNLKCYECDFICATEVDLKRHSKTCGLEYKCELCDVTYKTNERLLVHLMRKHPDLHEQYKKDSKSKKRLADMTNYSKKLKIDICDSPKRSFATQTLSPVENVKNDVCLWNSSKQYVYGAKTDEISTQTVFEDLLSLKSQTSEEDSIFFPETVSLSDIQTQTFPIEFGLHRSNKETVTSETQSPDLSIKETQTCYCLFDSPKLGSFKLFDSVSSNPNNLASTHTQTSDKYNKKDVLLCCNSAETQTCFDSSRQNI